MKSTEEVGLVFGTHPLDDDDLTPDIVSTVLRKQMGEHNPSVGVVTDDIVTRLRAFHLAETERWLASIGGAYWL